MSATAGDLKHAAQVQLVQAQKAEEKAEDTQHPLNLLLNFGLERFHTALTADGAVHSFELGTVRSLPATDQPDLTASPRRTQARRIVLWRTMFPQGHAYASAFPMLEFESLPKTLEPGNELRNLLERAIAKIPPVRSFIVVADSAEN